MTLEEMTDWLIAAAAKHDTVIRLQTGDPGLYGALIEMTRTLTAAGVAWAAVPALLRVRFGVLEVISTLLLNFVAEALVSWRVLGPLQESKHTYPQSDPLPWAARLPQFPGSRLHLGLLVALCLALALWLFGRRTLAGFQLRAVGLSPAAARVMGGVRPERFFAAALLVSGIIKHPNAITHIIFKKS